jgi:winged helix-turn helix protein
MLALVLDGADRKTAAETCGMDRQTLRDWLHRYNAKGLAGLRNLIKSSGPGSKLTTRQQAELNWPSLSRPVPIRRATGWWVGGASICATKLERRFGVVLTNVQGAPTARRAPYAIPSTYLISSSQSGVRCFDAAGRNAKIKRLKEATEFRRN